MSFAGLTWSQLWPVLGVAALAVTGLYLLKMKRRQVEVPFAALWEQVLRQSESRQLWRRLRRLLSWLLQILILALIGLALMDPRPSEWLSEPRTLAVVVDASASMAGKSEDPDSRTRLDAALTRARTEFEALGPNDRGLLIVAGSELSVPGPLGADVVTMDAALDMLQPQPGEADLAGALALARNALADQPQPAIVVLTDGALPARERVVLRKCVDRGLASAGAEDPNAKEPTCAVAEFHGPNANLAITAFAARRYPGDREKVEVLAQVHNLGDTPAKARLRIAADGIEIGSVEMELAPGASQRKIVERLDAARDELTAKLEGVGDAGSLGPAIDDEAWAVVPPLDPVQVALVTDGGDLFLEGALLTLDDYVRLTPVAVAQGGADNPEISGADIVFYDIASASLPKPLPATNLVIFDPHRNADSPAPIPKKRDLTRPRLTEQDRKHPILRSVVFKDVNMTRGTSFDLAPGDVALVSHLGEAIVALREGDHGVLQIGFDPRQSDFPMRVAFVLLVANSVDYFARRSAGFVAAVPVGASREIGLADLGLDATDLNAVEVIGPDERRQVLAVQSGRFRMRATTPGIHRIRALDGVSANAEVQLAVNMADLEASNLTPRLDDLPEAGRAGEAPEPATIDAGRPWTWLALLVLGIVCLEWLTYHRRRTV